MIIKSTDNPAGFTLIEVIMTVFIFSMIALGLFGMVSSILVSSGKQDALLSDSDQARKVANQLTNELRNATTANSGAYPIGQADNQALLLYSNIDGDAEVERIRYFVQSGTLRRGVTQFAGGTYNPASEVVTTVQNNLGNGANPLFYYYDGTFDGTADNFLAQPVNINSINYVKLNLVIINRGGRTNLNTYSVTAGAAIRNLKINL